MDDSIYKTKFWILCVTNDLVWGSMYVWWRLPGGGAGVRSCGS